MPYIGKKPADVISTAIDATTGTFSGEVDAASLDISGNIDVDGTTNLDVVDIDGALTQDGGAVFNEAGASVDFRVEADTDANALVVDASGNRVGIGVAAPASKLEISAGVNSHGLLRLDDTDAGNLGGYMQFDSNGTNKANVQNANNAGIHLCVGTGGTVTFTNLGYEAANALDDYEEGTFTATLEGSTTNPSSAVTLSSARYTKIGRQVLVQGQFTNVDTTGAAGGVRVTGLPFPASTAFASGNVMTYVRFTLGTTSTNISPYVSGSQIAFYQSTNQAGWGEIAHHAGTGAYLAWTGVYDTNS